MANIYTLKSGVASDTTVWSGGVVPVSGDRVLIDNPGTGGISFTTDAAGYAIGATSIVLIGSTATGSFVAGESVRFFNDPNYYAITSWTNATKTLVIAPLIIAIPAVETIVTNKGHVVTLDGAYTWGDDSTGTVSINGVSTTASIFVRGTLFASRTVNSSLTARGNVLLRQTTSGLVTGYDAGSAADPIPLGVTHDLILNYSTTSPSAGKYGFLQTFQSSTHAGGSATSFHGAYRRRNAMLLSAVAIGATSADMDDATGWQVGDSIVFAPTTSATAFDTASILTITPGAGTSATITFAALTYGHLIGAPVGNFSSNVTVKPYTSTLGSYLQASVRFNSGAAQPGLLHFENVRFESAPSGTYAVNGALCLNYLNYYPAGGVALDPLTSCAFWGVGTAAINSAILFSGSRQKLVMSDNAFYMPETGSRALFTHNADPICLLGAGEKYNVIYRLPISSQAIFASSASVAGDLNLKVFGCQSSTMSLNTAANFELVDPIFGPLSTASSVYITGAAIFGLTITNPDFGYTFGRGAAVAGLYPTTGGQIKSTITNALSASGLVPVSNSGSMGTGSSITSDAEDGDVLTQKTYAPEGNIVRENAVVNRSASSIRMDLLTSQYEALTKEITFSAPAGVAQTIVGYLRKNASYGALTLPSVSVTGLGITPVTYTMSGAADAWEKFTLSVTNTSGADGNLKLTFAGQSQSAAAVCYLDGVAALPFVSWTRHYGYTYDPSNPLRTVDPVVQLTEAQAEALTGISYAAGTLTVSSAHTIREVYDWMQWYECSNRLAPIMTSSDGISFALSADFDLSAALTGTGSLSMPSNTLTFAGSTTLNITHDAGVMTTIAVTGLVSGSRIQLVDMSGPTELYNDVPGTSLTINSNWTTDKTIRLRVGYAVGAVAKLPIETSGILSSTGASFLVSQVADPVYNALAIDDSTCTEFAPDYPNLQIDVSDGDGTTSVQRLYAWSAWAQTSEQGIDLMFQAVQATDTSNFVIDVDVVDAKLDNVTGSPVIVAGGYLARSDGTTVIAATSGSIHMDPGKAYLTAGAPTTMAAAVLAAAQAAPIYADMRSVKGQIVAGAGTEGDPWGPV